MDGWGPWWRVSLGSWAAVALSGKPWALPPCVPWKTGFLQGLCSGRGSSTWPSLCMASLVAQMAKSPPAVQETRLWSLGREDPLEKEWLPSPVFLPGEFHGQRSWAGYCSWGRMESDTTDWLAHFLCRFGIASAHEPGSPPNPTWLFLLLHLHPSPLPAVSFPAHVGFFCHPISFSFFHHSNYPPSGHGDWARTTNPGVTVWVRPDWPQVSWTVPDRTMQGKPSCLWGQSRDVPVRTYLVWGSEADAEEPWGGCRESQGTGPLISSACTCHSFVQWPTCSTLVQEGASWLSAPCNHEPGGSQSIRDTCQSTRPSSLAIFCFSVVSSIQMMKSS